MSIYSKDYHIDGWPITKNGVAMSKDAVIDELNSLAAKLSEAENREMAAKCTHCGNMLFEVDNSLIKDAERYHLAKEGASRGNVDIAICRVTWAEDGAEYQILYEERADEAIDAAKAKGESQ